MSRIAVFTVSLLGLNLAAGSAAADDLLPVGSAAPVFKAKSHDGKRVNLSKLRGKWVALYFYPKDDTPGCTKEACSIRDNWQALKAAGIVVFGVSTDDNTSHAAFAEKFKLPFSLLPDEKGAIAAQYKVPVVNGKARRKTYLIDPKGKIAHVWDKVDTAGHAGQILDQVAASKSAAKTAHSTKKTAGKTAKK